MFHQSNYVVVAIRFLSAALRVLLVWPGVVLVLIGFMFFVSTIGDSGGQMAASHMANIAQNYRVAPAGMVMVHTCPHSDDPVWDITPGSAAAPVLKRDCKPHPETFVDFAKQERRIILWIGSVLIVLGMLRDGGVTGYNKDGRNE
ncbi:Uncharacterised protein [Serratia rubidaea]|nr:Uncharacterised protein [Serratia rubidaea]